jgi:hypothetical protein
MERLHPPQVKDLKNLVLRYLEDGELGKLDALGQLSFILIAEAYVIDNIDSRCRMHLYPGDGRSLVDEVKQDVLRIIRFEQMENLNDSIGFFLRFYVSSTMQRHILHAIELASEEQRRVVAALVWLFDLGGPGHFQGAMEPTGFLLACRAAFGIPEKTVEQWLVGLGLANRYVYSSTYITHPAWNVPEWSLSAIQEIAKHRQNFRIHSGQVNDLVEEMKNEKARNLFNWMLSSLQGGTQGIIRFDEWEQGKSNYGSIDFENQLGRLVSLGGMTMVSSTGRNIEGYYLCLNPEALAAL